MPLDDNDAGDEAFDQLVVALRQLLEPACREWAGWSKLVALCGGDESLATGVFHIAGETALTWMYQRPPVLEGMSGAECVVSPHGLKWLKEAILRFGEVAG